jgi:hypothetical protein
MTGGGIAEGLNRAIKRSAMTGGGIAEGLNRAIEHRAEARRVSASEGIPL